MTDEKIMATIQEEAGTTMEVEVGLIIVHQVVLVDHPSSAPAKLQ